MSSPIMVLQQVGTQQVGYWTTYPTGTSSCKESDSTKAARLDGVDISASGDDASAKVRKPYTITKQRERWTEDEHQKFLEALKLYGRAWRRIEEHIGTKTAVQIRSHAQKFFSKLERKSSVGSSSVTGVSQDIEIPPPRPKRKPSHPYPRKAGGAFSISSSFEDDSKSPRAVCSAFTPLGSTTGLNMWKAPLKNLSKTTSPTSLSSLSQEPISLQEVSHEAEQRGGLSASLRLFGQTVLVPGIDISVLDTEHQIDPSDSIGLESESTASLRSEVSTEFDENSGILSSRCSIKDAEMEDKNAFSCQQAAVGASSDNESSVALVFDSNECLPAHENNMESSKGAQEGVLKEQKWKFDLSCHTDGSNDSAISNLTSSNPTPPKSPLEYSPHRVSAPKHASQVLEGVSPPTLPNSGGSCFTPWHLSREIAKQHQTVFPTSATAVWPRLPPEQFFQRSNEDASAAVAVAAASFAVASAWQVIQGPMPAAIGHPNISMVYSPVAILAGPTEHAYGSATIFSGPFSPLEQHKNPSLVHKKERGSLEVAHRHTAGNEIEDEMPEMHVKDGNSEVISTEQGCSCSHEACMISCESSCENRDETPLKKRFRILSGTKTGACKSLSRTHSSTCDMIVSESEGNEVVQHDSTNSVTVQSFNSFNNEASSMKLRKDEGFHSRKHDMGLSGVVQSSGERQRTTVHGMQISEVLRRQNILINKDEDVIMQKEMHDEEIQVCKRVGSFDHGCDAQLKDDDGNDKQSLPFSDDGGGAQPKDDQPSSSLTQKSVSISSESNVDAPADKNREITLLEESEKSPVRSNIDFGNGDKVRIPSNGGPTDSEMQAGKHQFLSTGKLDSASRYSGVGFVPYKRAFQKH